MRRLAANPDPSSWSDPPDVPEPVQGAQSVARAMALLKQFTDAHPTWRLSDLARAEGLHRATAYRLLTALEREGVLTRDIARDHYRLGPEAIALGARALRANDVRAVSHDELSILVDATHETATVETLVGPDMLIIDEVPGRGLVSPKPSVGTRWPAHATSTGKAVLATMGAAAVERALGPKLARFTERTIVTHAELARDLADIRRRGWAIAAHELEIGYVAVGAVLRGQSGHAVGAISVGGSSARLTTTRLQAFGRQCKASAARISAALGWRGAA